MNIVFGMLSDELGLASTTVATQGKHGPELRHRVWASPAAEFRSAQESEIPIDQDHDGRACGEVVYLERDEHGRLWAVGHVDERVRPAVSVRLENRSVSVPTPLYWSASRWGGEETGGLILNALSLTASPARISPKPVTILEGRLDYRGCERRYEGLTVFERGLLGRAAIAHLDRRRGEPITVCNRSASHDPRHELTHPAEILEALEEQHYAWMGRPLEYRPSRIIAVR